MNKLTTPLMIGNYIVPAKIGHGYIPLEVLDIKLLHEHPFASHHRLRVFHAKGLDCTYCPKKGLYLIRAKGHGGSIHIDLYTDQFELMTVDHIIPRSKGGSDLLENLVPACNKCNSKKDNKNIEDVCADTQRFPLAKVNLNNINLSALV